MALAHCDVKLELREILLKNRPQELLAISPKGTVPVLQLENGEVIDESIDIMEWVLKFKTSNWMDLDYKTQKKIININDTKFKYWLDKYKYHDRYPENTKDYYFNQCATYLNELQNLLNKNLFFMGNKIQMVDVALMPFIRQFAYVDLEKFNNKFPKLYQYLNKFIKSKLFLSIMKKYDVWDNKSIGLILNFNK